MNITQGFVDTVLRTLKERGPCSWYEIEDFVRGDFPTVNTEAVIRTCGLLRKQRLVAASCYTEDYNDAEKNKHRFVSLNYTPDWNPKTALPHWYKTRNFTPRSFVDDLKDKIGRG